LFETARQSLVQGELEIKIPRQSARTKKSKQKAKAKRPMRNVKVSVRYLQVKLNPPSYYKDKVTNRKVGGSCERRQSASKLRTT